MASILLAVITKGFDERRYLQSIDIVPATLALRFEYVAPSLVCISGNADGVLTFRCVIERIYGSESVTYAADIFGG